MARVAAALLLLVLSAETTSPLLAAGAAAGAAMHHTGDGNHHPGCPWRQRGEPCPHAPGGGTSLTMCSDPVLAGADVAAAPAIVGDLVPRVTIAVPAVEAAPQPLPRIPASPAPSPDPPPPRSDSVL